MSNEFAGILASATTEAQANLGKLATPNDGPDDADGGTILFEDIAEPKQGVFGRPQIQRIMERGGGYSQIVILPFTTTRDQYDAAPLAEKLCTRLSPREQYRIRDVDTHDPFVYILTLVKLGRSPR